MSTGRRRELYLMGAGIRGALHFTTETLQAIRHCHVVFTLLDDLAVLEYVRQLGPTVVDLASLYTDSTSRPVIYRRISEQLIAATAEHEVVGFLVHGHPLFLVSASEYTLDLARTAQVDVHILPGVSSFDTILCDLAVDHGYGMQLFEATTLVKNGWRPNPALPTLIFQLATLMTENVVRDVRGCESLRVLVDLLTPLYPAGHRCTVVHSAAQLLEPPTRVTIALAELCSNDEIELWTRPTLYVPACPA